MEILEKLKAFLRELTPDPARLYGLAWHVAHWVLALSETEPDDPLEALEGLIRGAPAGIREELGKHPRTPEEILRILARDKDKWVRLAVAKNPNAPAEVLRILAKDRSAMVRGAVARAENAPEDSLRKLAKDGHKGVRESVAANRKAPVDLLLDLLDDPSTWVAEAAAKNPALPLSALIERFKRGTEGMRIWSILDRLIAELDSLPRDLELWRKMWEMAGAYRREKIEAHPFGKGVALLAKLGR